MQLKTVQKYLLNRVRARYNYSVCALSKDFVLMPGFSHASFFRDLDAGLDAVSHRLAVRSDSLCVGFADQWRDRSGHRLAPATKVTL
jgi:hypothetical protein